MNRKSILQVLSALSAGAVISGCNSSEAPMIHSDAVAVSATPEARPAMAPAPTPTPSSALEPPSTAIQPSAKASVGASKPPQSTAVQAAVTPRPTAAEPVAPIGPGASVASVASVAIAKPIETVPVPTARASASAKHGAQMTCGAGSCG